MAVLESEENIQNFAVGYIKNIMAAGSSELAANAKKEVRFTEALHGLVLETAEDALLMAEACQDLTERLPGGKNPEKPRKARRK